MAINLADVVGPSLIIIFTILIVPTTVTAIEALLFTRGKWGANRVLKLLLPLPVIARDIEMIIYGSTYLEEGPAAQPAAQVILASLPGYIFLSLFLYPLALWIMLYHYPADLNTDISRTKRTAILYVSAVVTMISVWFIFMVLLVTLPAEEMPFEVIHACEALYSTFLNLFGGSLFLVYGYRMYRTMYDRLPAPYAQHIIRLSVTCALSMFLRGVVVPTAYFVPSASWRSVIAVIGNLFGEALPVVVIWLLVVFAPARSQDQHRSMVFSASASSPPPLYDPSLNA